MKTEHVAPAPPINFKAPKAVAAKQNTARPPLPLNQYMTLRDAEKLTKVSYDTMVWANGASKLEILRIDNSTTGHTLWVHAGHLTDYMISHAPKKKRWKPVKIKISSPCIHPETNVRPVNPDEVKQLADASRRGAAIPPIWITQHDGNDIFVDGRHRHDGMADANKTVISAVRVKLPIQYARAIAIYANSKHGRRVSDTDLKNLVHRYLDDHPDIRGQLDAGELSRADLADLVCVSESTVSRALNPDNGEQIEPKRLLKELMPLCQHLNHSSGDSDAKFVALIYHTALGRYISKLPKLDKADIRRRLALNASPICDSISPWVRSLVLRQGGVRTRGASSTARKR